MRVELTYLVSWFGAISVGWMNLLTVLGFVGTTIGIWLTWKQARAAKAKAASAEQVSHGLREAVQLASRRIARQDLFSAIVLMRQLIEQLASAERSKSTEFTEQALVQLANHMAEVRALRDQDATRLLPDEIDRRLESTQRSALDAKASLARDALRDIPRHTRGLRRHLDSLAADLKKYEIQAKYDHTQENEVNNVVI